MDKEAKAEINGLAVASLIFGILSILTCWTVVLSVPQALLAFMFALLSRGNKRKCGVAKTGTICGIAGLVFTLIVILSVLNWLWQLYTNITAFVDMIGSYLNDIQSTLNGIGSFFTNLFQNGIGGLLQ